MALLIEHLPYHYVTWRARYAERDIRQENIASAVKGEFGALDPDGEAIEQRSLNWIQVGAEDTAEASALMPTLRVVPSSAGPKARDRAARMERIGAGYMDISRMDLLIPQSVLQASLYGFFAWVITPDKSIKAPMIELRDSRTIYPEPGHRPGSPIQRCMVVREVDFTQLSEDHQAKMADYLNGANDLWKTQMKVTLIEWYDQDEMVLAALFDSRWGQYQGGTTPGTYTPVELERIENRIGHCPVVVGSRITFDGEFRGQWDQTIGPAMAHQRLRSMLIDYADQAVYSDLWVKDQIGEVPWGGGAMIQLGPQGDIGRVEPARSGLDVWRDLEALENEIHTGGRWPKSRPGEIDQSIASAKFLETASGMMSTAIRTYHLILKHALEKALRVCYLQDRAWFPGVKTTAGILRNQEFLDEYDSRKDIDPSYRVKVEYGLGLGRDPGQAAVLGIQYHQNGFVSTEYIQENIEGVTDVALEQRRINQSTFEDMMKAKLLKGVEEGTVPDRALLEMLRGIEQGKTLSDLFEKYIVSPQEEALETGIQSGLTGELQQPGMAPGAGGIQPAGLGGAMGEVPPAPDASEAIAQLGMPAGAGNSFMSVR